MSDIEFNLTEEKWIRVLLPDYQISEVSLQDALLNAHNYLDLAGEISTQNLPVLRLLLAVLHTVFSRVDLDGNEAPFLNEKDAENRWHALWMLGRFPEKPISQYLSAHKDDFWLFHPERPFGQTPSAEIGTKYEAGKLNGELSESNNKLRLFPQRTMDSKKSLSYSEAIRWLLYANAFDDTSAKPKGKDLPSPGAGWLGKLGLIHAVGKNLFETLMLNFVLLSNDHQLWGDAHPNWELMSPRNKERIEIALPDNQAELLTLQSRRLLLTREKNRVIGYSVLGGDFFQKENAICEQMTVWKEGKAPGNRAPSFFLPRRHDSSRQIWRDFCAIFTKSNDSAVPLPGVINWVTRVLGKEKNLITFRTVSVQYGDKDFFVADVFSDSLTFHTTLLDEESSVLVERVEKQITKCDEAAKHIALLADHLSLASSGVKNESARKTAKEQLYYRLDDPFRRWLFQLSPDIPDIDSYEEDWEKTASRIVLDLGQEMVQQAGETTFAGRYVKDKTRANSDVEYLYSAPKAYNTFIWRINMLYNYIREE